MEASPRPEAIPAPRIRGVAPALFAQDNGARHVPADLQVTPDCRRRFLVIGGCLAEPFTEVAALMNKDFKGDLFLVNNFELVSGIPAAQAAQYDFQIIHIPLRTILGQAYFCLLDDGSGHERFLPQTEDYLARYLANVLKFAFLAYLGRRLATNGVTVILGQLLPTGANLAGPSLNSRNGFNRTEENPQLWSRSLVPPPTPPPHVFLSAPEIMEDPPCLVELAP